jgi:hypothetical protein
MEDTNEIEVQRFGAERQLIYPEKVAGGHNGADTLLMSAFVKQLSGGAGPGASSGIVSARSHLIAFAAESSRLSGNTVDMRAYTNSLSGRKA